MHSLQAIITFGFNRTAALSVGEKVPIVGAALGRWLLYEDTSWTEPASASSKMNAP